MYVMGLYDFFKQLPFKRNCKIHLQLFFIKTKKSNNNNLYVLSHYIPVMSIFKSYNVLIRPIELTYKQSKYAKYSKLYIKNQ